MDIHVPIRDFNKSKFVFEDLFNGDATDIGMLGITSKYMYPMILTSSVHVLYKCPLPCAGHILLAVWRSRNMGVTLAWGCN